jgi:hypothetical protein
MFRRTLVTATLALALLWAAPVAAQTVEVDPDGAGAGGTIDVTSLDWNVGNSVAVDFSIDPTQLDDPAYIDSLVGSTFQVYYQANLSLFNLEGGGTLATNETSPDGTLESWTLVLGFAETLTGIIPISTDADPTTFEQAILVFGFGDQTGFDNFFQIYANDESGDNLTGECFVCGTEIMEGTFTSTDFASNFTVTNLDPTGVPLDNAPPGDNDWPGVETITGSGTVFLTASVTDYSSLYFTDPTQLITFAFTPGTGTALPFLTVDPTACFFDSNGLLTCGGGLTYDGGSVTALAGVPDVGSQNGISGPNIMFQTDANSTFQVEQQTVVPEPATLTLLGLGLAGSAAVRRRRNAKK